MDREIVLATRDNYFIIHTFENELKITLLPLEDNNVYSEIFLG